MDSEFSDKQLQQLQNEFEQLRASIVEPLKRYIDKKFAENAREHDEVRAAIREVRDQVGQNTLEIRKLDQERLAIVARQDRFERARR